MIRQYKAGFLDKTVFEAFRQLLSEKDYEYRILGLLDHVTTFDLISNLNFDLPENPHSLLAVANNIISRGCPTIASRLVSEKIASFNNNFTEYDFFNSLHLLDYRPGRPELYADDLGSQFEAAFLNNYIPSKGKILTQLFQHQRDLRTLTAGHKHGFTDFSFESPYYKVVEVNDIYHKSKRIKQRESINIIEIDGAKYHQNISLDDARDFETAKFGALTSRIHEAEPDQDVNLLMNKLNADPYLTIIHQRITADIELTKSLQNFVLIPLAIARIQKTINQFILCSHPKSHPTKIKVAIVERDVPCAALAVEDLNQLYFNLINLSDINFVIPEIDVTVFPSPDFDLSISNAKVHQPDSINPAEFDLIIDISVLWRTGIFKADKDFSAFSNAAIIRSAHFTDEALMNPVYCAMPVKYRKLTTEIGNENHDIIPEALPFIEYFLQNIFFKDNFRKGQLPILNRALQNASVIGLLPTGGGKSLTYQLAALLQPGITLIVDPIRSLMVDQYESLISIGIDKCDFINSILKTSERLYVQNKILPNGLAQFIFCSPERLVIQEFRDALKLTFANKVYFSYCVIDEAHCVSEWGHDFRTPYLNLGENAIQYCKTADTNDLPLFGLTATASFDVLADIERELKIPKDDGNAVIRYENTVRDELHYEIRKIQANEEDDKKVDKKSVGAEKIKQTHAILTSIYKSENNLLQMNTREAIEKTLHKTYTEFLPEFEKKDNKVEEFIQKGIISLSLNDNQIPTASKKDTDKFNHGIIIFCPHTGKPNKFNTQSELGVLKYYNALPLQVPSHRFGYFIGSGNDINAAAYDKHSFANLKKFKENNISVMVATKAFGMGIDKDNIRQTIHVNIPSSIESFVQESGRAGRDGKTALSVILYNNQISRDRDVILSFHLNAFKGADKERSVLYELRNGIYHPISTRLHSINQQINDEFETEIHLELGKSGKIKDWSDFLFVKNENNDNIGSINLVSKWVKNNASEDLKSSKAIILDKIIDLIDDFATLSKDQIRAFLEEKIDNPSASDGIEKLLKDADIGTEFTLQIPFSNCFYAKSESNAFDIVDEFAFDNHFEHLCESSLIKNLFIQKIISHITLKDKFKASVKYDNTYEEFIKSLPFDDSKKESLKSAVRLRVRYYIPRNASDTAKAIYRLSSVGIIDTYTIDYLNKQYQIKFTKKPNETYFENFTHLVGRYTSNLEAKKIVDACRHDLEDSANATTISKILEHLTFFIYNKIADKRLRAIDDMVNLCNESIRIADPVEQSERIKENIYYYFNAKYTRRGNKATLTDGTEIDADLNFDFENNTPISDTIWKYIENVIRFDDNNAIINNIKHLRGASMRMLRSRTGTPQYNILKAFALFILSANVPNLLEEAQNELAQGMLLWHETDPHTFNFNAFYQRFKQNIETHLGQQNDDFFGNPEDYFLVSKNLAWLKNFNHKFLKT
jgi:ATP-dependent DNA helicase RecQ